MVETVDCFDDYHLMDLSLLFPAYFFHVFDLHKDVSVKY